MSDMGEYFRDIKAHKAAKRAATFAAADKSGWSQFSPHHFYRQVDGHRLEWWPSSNKWLYKGKYYRGGLPNTIKELNQVNAVAKTNSALPAHLQGGKTASFGNIDSSDLIIPRVKLMQSVSPEVTAYDDAKMGEFWHTLAEQSLGKELRIIPISLKKEIVLWAPRGDDRGILARSSDTKKWDDGYANLEFEVKIKGQKEAVRYFTKGSVAESGLANFGTMIPGDPDSRPAASLTYRMMFLFPDYLDLGPAIIINTRSSLRAAKGLISKIELRPTDHYNQVYTMGTTDEKGDEGDYKGYKYTSAGFVTEEEGEIAKATYEKYGSVDWKANEEDDEAAPTGDAAPRSKVSESDVAGAKF